MTDIAENEELPVSGELQEMADGTVNDNNSATAENDISEESPVGDTAATVFENDLDDDLGAEFDAEANAIEAEETDESSDNTPVERDETYYVAALEALLFATGEAVSKERLMAALEIDSDTFEVAISELMDRFETEDHGIRVIRLENAYQMCTKEQFYDELIRLELSPKKPNLSDVAMETLSIIAYKQPVTKAEIARIRGVNSDHAVNKLVEYRLVKELGRLNAPGRPILFGTSEEFLRSFGVASPSELPEIDAVKAQDMKAEAEAEALFGEKVQV